MVRTQALKKLKDSLGHTNFHINTLIIGLEAVKTGLAKKSDELTISWSCKNESEREIAAAQARRFVTRATLVLVVDAIDQYLFQLGTTPGYLRDEGMRSYLRGDVHTFVEKKGRDKEFQKERRPKIDERFDKLTEAFDVIRPNSYLAIIHLLISWRNRTVHSNNNADIAAGDIQKLKADRAYFSEHHSAIDIAATTDHFKAGEYPTLKDLSTMISVVHRVFKSLDAAVVEAFDSEKFIAHVLYTEVSRFRRSQKPNSLYETTSAQRERALTRILQMGGVDPAETKKSIVVHEFVHTPAGDVDALLEKYAPQSN